MRLASDQGDTMKERDISKVIWKEESHKHGYLGGGGRRAMWTKNIPLSKMCMNETTEER